MNLKNDAMQYAQSGWAVFMVHGITDDGKCTCGHDPCPNAGKHPSSRNGLKDARTDRQWISTFWQDGKNIGVATGEASGFWAFDIDGQAGMQSLEALEQTHGKLPETLTHFTGNGRHLLFKWPGYAIKNSVKRIGDGLDVRGDGGYIVAAPSRHVSGSTYQFADENTPIADAPQWLLDLVRKDQPQAINHDPETGEIFSDAPAKETYSAPIDRRHDNTDIELSASEVSDMLAFIPPDTDYQEWVSVGMGLHAGGYAVTLWDDWSKRGTKYKAGECYKKWSGFNPSNGITFGTVWHIAEQHGWSIAMVKRDKETATEENHPAAGFLAKLRGVTHQAQPAQVDKSPSTSNRRGLPFNPEHVTGLIGDTVRWIVSTSIRKQPELALLNTLAAMAAVMGRKYATKWNTRPNLYVVGLGETGCGKDHSRKSVKSLFSNAGLAGFLAGDKFVSDSGIIAGLSVQPEQLLMIDELGMVFEGIKDKNAGSHLKGIVKTLTEMYSSSGSTYNGGHYAGTGKEKKEPVVINSPSLSIFGTSTLEKYKSALTTETIVSGELNRYIVIQVSDDLPDGNDDAEWLPPPASLVNQWKTIGEYTKKGQGNIQQINSGNPAIAAPDPIIVSFGSCVDRIADIGRKADRIAREAQAKNRTGIWTRYRENVLKIAMISAVARCHNIPVIEDSDLDFAEAIVMHSCGFVNELAENHIANNEIERTFLRVAEVVRNSGNAWISRSEIGSQTRGVKPKERNDILAELAEQDRVEVRQVQNGAGRPTVEYRWKHSAG
jgi:hypothetical protein